MNSSIMNLSILQLSLAYVFIFIILLIVKLLNTQLLILSNFRSFKLSRPRTTSENIFQSEIKL